MKTYKERANDVSRKLRKRRQQRRTAVLSVAMAVCVLAAVLFVPYRTTLPDVTMYAGSDYYPVIQLFNEYNYTPPAYRNNFEKWGSYLSDKKDVDGDKDLIYDEVLGHPEPVEGELGTQITDNQVDGVYEGDLIKRTESYIFYLTRGTLIIYSIAQEESTQVGKVELEDYVHTSWSFYYTNQEMYLSADGKTVTLVLPGVCYQTGAVGQMIWLLNLDVSDPKNVTKISEFYVQGAYQSSRLVDGKLLLMSRFTPDDDLDYGTPETFVPRVGTELDELDPIAADKIQLPTQMTSGSYTVVTMLDSDTLELVDAGAFLSCSTEIYVSQERIYASRSYAMVEENGNFRYSTPMTEISCMGYGPQGLKMLGTFQVEGTVQNQYSMDEYNGIFRVVTTVNQIGYWIGGQTVDVMATPGSSANLTCFYVDTWEEAGKLEHFAPNGESVQSVRFEENYAYVCTAVLMSDPVFFIDMTDLSNITAKDTGTITGYSSSLVQLGDGLLLGIGYGEQWELKVEIYRETDDGVVSVCAYSGSEWFASDYKAYYIDRENRYFGIPTAEGYVLLHFNGTALVELANVPFKFIQLNQARGVVIDQWLYVCADEMVVQQLTKVNEQ